MPLGGENIKWRREKRGTQKIKMKKGKEKEKIGSKKDKINENREEIRLTGTIGIKNRRVARRGLNIIFLKEGK
jgi:hypothetical protein